MTIVSDCPGWITTLRAEVVLFSGKVFVRGEHMERRLLRQHAQTAGGLIAPDRSEAVTVLVAGDMWTGPLRDGRRSYSQKLVYIEELMRRRRRHIHVLDGTGFGELLDGRPATCHDLIEPIP